jgi:hypothetical protein
MIPTAQNLTDWSVWSKHRSASGWSGPAFGKLGSIVLEVRGPLETGGRKSLEQTRIDVLGGIYTGDVCGKKRTWHWLFFGIARTKNTVCVTLSKVDKASTYKIAVESVFAANFASVNEP